MSGDIRKLGFGASALGGLFAEVDETTARATVDRAWELGIRSFDTAPLYGSGLSERRLGAALRARPRDEYVLSTKVGRVLRPGQPDAAFVGAPALAPVFDYSRAGVLRSLEESRERLGIAQIDIALIHDPEAHMDEALAAVEALRNEVAHVGVGTNVAETALRFMRETAVDTVLIAGRLTLLDQSAADELLPLAATRDVDLIVGGVYNSGILAGGRTFDYAAAPTAIVARAQELREICSAYGVPLAAAAIQFPLRYAATSRLLVGARSPAEVETNVELLATDIPEELWRELSRPA